MFVNGSSFTTSIQNNLITNISNWRTVFTQHNLNIAQTQTCKLELVWMRYYKTALNCGNHVIPCGVY